MTFAKFRLPASRRASPQLLPLLAGGLLLLALWGLQFNPYLNPADDSGRYMVLGESVARSGSLRLLNDAKHQLDTLYPPGLPLIIAFWIRLTGRDPGGVVSLVKATNIALLLLALPFLHALLKRAKLSRGWQIAGILAFALCPAVALMGNEVMAESPFLVLCLASVVLAEKGIEGNKGERKGIRGNKEETGRLDDAKHETEEDAPNPERQTPNAPIPLSFPFRSLFIPLLCAGAAFLVRTAGVSLLIAQIIWFFKRLGWRWGIIALVVAGMVVGGWQTRNRRIAFYHPTVHYDSYVNQFTMRDPSQLGAGRIALSPAGIAERASTGIPNYIGMIPRVLLTMMAPPRSLWLGWFYLLAVPMTLLILLGFAIAWRRGLHLSCGFSALFWLFAAMWPWVNPRFLLPILPFLLLFFLLGASRISIQLARAMNQGMVRGLQIAFAILLLIYWGRVHVVLMGEQGKRTLPNYALGRTPEEGGFYAACAFLKMQGTEREVVMGRPQYLLHLYSGHATTQIEPVAPEHAQMEEVYVKKAKATWLLEDQWSWSHSDKYLGAYLRQFAPRWNLAWQDPQGSGVRVWRRVVPAPVTH